jgi:ribonuclease D
MAAISTSNKIPAENIMTPDYLRQLCFEPDGLTEEAISRQLLALGARKWQVELVSAEIAQAWKKSETKAS